MTDQNLELRVEHKPLFSFALEQSGVPLVGPIYIVNNDPSPLENAILEVALSPDLGEALYIAIPRLHGGEGCKFEVIDIHLPPGRLAKTLESERIILECSVKQEDQILKKYQKEVTLLAYNDYSLKDLYLELLACFVTPNHPVIMQVLKQVREILKSNTGDNSLPGYQTGNPQKVYEMTKALYETFKELGISYINPPASFEDHQKIRFADQVLQDQMGTCLDLSVLACSCLEQMGLYPLFVIIKGHAFIGVWLQEEKCNHDLIIDDKFKLINFCQSGNLLVFNSSSYAEYPQPSFQQAIDVAFNYLNNTPLVGVVDIKIARYQGYKPLPIRMEAVETTEVDHAEITSLAKQILKQAALAQKNGEVEPIPTQKIKEKLPETVEKRFQRWKASLLDLSAKNRLLNLANLDVSKFIAEILIEQIKVYLAGIINNHIEESQGNTDSELIDQLIQIFESIKTEKILGKDFNLSQQFNLDAYVKSFNQNIEFPFLQQALYEIIEQNKQALIYHAYQAFLKKVNIKKQTFIILDIHDKLLPEFEDYLASGQSIEIIPGSDDKDQRNQQLLQNRSDESEILARKASDLSQGKCQAVQGLGLPILCDSTWLSSIGKILEKEAIVSKEETGASNLYVALGLLEYKEKGKAIPQLAPLFLYPINLTVNRSNYRVNFKLGDNDPLGNVTLFEKIRKDYGLEIQILAKPPEDESGFDITKAFQEIRKVIANQPGWLVIDAVVITTFNFGKFLLWKDLQDNTEILLKNPLVQHIAMGGLQPLADPVGEIQPQILDTLPMSEIPMVVDADSSQLSAVYAALQGRSFVLQGPPGTGKSQTITNLIAAFLAKGKSVLFVAEKMTALEVVQRRLNQIGLGDFCLELHSDKANRKQVITSLATSLNQERLSNVPLAEIIEELEQIKQQLTTYPQILHHQYPIGNSLYGVLGELTQLDNIESIHLSGIDIDNLTQAQLKKFSNLLDQYVIRAKKVGAINQNSWKISNCCESSLSLQDEISNFLNQLKAKLSNLDKALTAFLTTLSIDIKPSLNLLRQLPQIGLDLVAGGIYVGAFDGEKWLNIYQFTNGYLQSSRQILKHQTQLAQHWNEQIYTCDLEKQLKTFEQVQKSFPLLRWFLQIIPRFALRSFTKGKLPDNEQIIKDLRLALEFKKLHENLQRQKQKLDKLFAPVWKPDYNNISELQGLLERSHRFYNFILTLDDEFMQIIQKMKSKATEKVIHYPQIQDKTNNLIQSFNDLELTLNQFMGKIQNENEIIVSSSQDFINQLHNLVTQLSLHKSNFSNWCLYNQICSELAQNHLNPLIEAHRQGEIELEDIHKVLLKSILRPWFVKNFDTQPVLRNFEGGEQSQKIEKFSQLQKQYLKLCQDFIRANLAEKLPGNNVVFEGSEIGIIKKENLKQKGHISIRSFFKKIPNLLPRLKPCFFMSPLSVAQYLPADGTKFDLVVFDEASQLETHDAIGAIARGKQVIIVGDSKQMPPTRSVGKNNSDSITNEDDIVDLESLLDEAIASQFPEQMLQWHYRSRHETLIDFSNRNYYDGKLTIFPTANSFNPSLGLKWHHTPDGFYEPGERTNKREATVLVGFLVQQLRTYQRHERTFGIITFSLSQKEVIDQLLEDARKKYPEIEPHFDKEFSEKVFVKNLESVQGDERDEILFSICYAPTQHGQMSMKFGNLNNAGGERRLNVALTRARLCLRIFSTITASQIDLNRTNTIGVSHLKDFLEFAEKLGTSNTTQFLRTNDFDSGIEKEIYQALVDMGYTVNCKVGCGDYRIDLAVFHPHKSDVYVLGIETDGKTYQSAATVQDREGVRPSVLQSLNWCIHRIWSLDWQFKRAQELERLKQALETAIQKFDQEDTTNTEITVKTNQVETDKSLISNLDQLKSLATEPPEINSFKSSSVTKTSLENSHQISSVPTPIIPYQIAELKIVTTENQLIYNDEAIPIIKQQILSIVEIEAPILITDIVRSVAQCWSFSKVSQALSNRITEQLNQLVEQKQSWCHQDFLWTSKEQWENLQFARQPIENRKRKIEQIPVEELAVAAKWIIAQSLSIGEEDLYKAIASLFSLGKLNDKIKLKMNEAVTLVCNKGKVKRDSNGVVMILK